MANKVSVATSSPIFAGMDLTDIPLDFAGDQVVKRLYLDRAKLHSVDLEDCTSLMFIQMIDIESLAGQIKLEGCSALEEIIARGWPHSTYSIGDLPALKTLDIRDSDNISEVNLGEILAIESITAGNCPNLEEIGISENFTALVDLKLFDCALTQSVVNDILVTLDAAGAENGEVDLAGGTSAAPNGAGATAVTSLEGKGWNVNTN